MYQRRDCYSIMDIDEYEKNVAKIKLMGDLLKGRKSGDEDGWISADDVKRHFQEKKNGC